MHQSAQLKKALLLVSGTIAFGVLYSISDSPVFALVQWVAFQWNSEWAQYVDPFFNGNNLGGYLHITSSFALSLANPNWIVNIFHSQRNAVEENPRSLAQVSSA